MWVSAVGPEQYQPVKQRLDVGHVGFPLWKDPEDAAVLLGVPVLVEVVDAGDAAAVTVWVVHVFDVARPVSWVTRHHGLERQRGEEEVRPWRRNRGEVCAIIKKLHL